MPDEAATGMGRDGNGPGISERLRVPLYHQIYLVLRDKIVTGMWPDGRRLPNEDDLSAQFGVSRITVRRALDDLSTEGLVQRRRGTGTTVTFRPPERPVVVDFSNMLAQLRQMGASTEARVLELDLLPPPPEVAVALAIPEGELAHRAVRVRSVEGRPFSHLTTWVPAGLAAGIGRPELEATSLHKLLEDRGIRVASARQTVTATLADPQIAAVLEVDVGAALFTIVRLVRDDHGRGVEHLTAHYRPDRYQFNMELSRVQDAEDRTWQTSF